MFDQVFENLCQASEFNLRTQQRLLKKWACLWGMPACPNDAGDQSLKAQQQWTDFVTDLIKRPRETLEPQFKAGLKIVEDACHLVEAKDSEELRARTMQLWQKSFDCVRQLCEAQMGDFETAVTRWLELMTKGTVPQQARPAYPEVGAPAA